MYLIVHKKRIEFTISYIHKTKLEVRIMGKQIFNRTKKILGILLVIFFVASVTAVTVSAAPYHHHHHHHHGHWGVVIMVVIMKNQLY
jgi:hypothetical protein